MIVERGHIGLIRSGRRTQTRRLVDSREPGYRVRTGRRGQSHSLVKPWVPKVGDRVPIQVVGEKAELYVVVMTVRTERAGATTRDDAIACGYQTLTAWKAAWVREYGKDWVARERRRQQVRALIFDEGYQQAAERHVRVLADVADQLREVQWLADEGLLTPRPDDGPPVLATLSAVQLAARFDSRHADQLVWVIDHVVATDEKPRLLAARPGSAQADYVSAPAQAATGEPEAVDEKTLGEFVKANAEKPMITRREFYMERRAEIAKQIRALEAADLGRDVRSTLRALRRQLETLDRKMDVAA